MTPTRRSNRLGVAFVLAGAFCLATTQLVSAAHAVRAEGSGDVHSTWGIDLDNGVFNTTSDRAEDLKFHILSETERYIQPYHSDVRIKKMASQPGYAKCKGAALLFREYDVATIPTGTWFCVKTHKGRFARVRFDGVEPAYGDLHLTFTTWEF